MGKQAVCHKRMAFDILGAVIDGEDQPTHVGSADVGEAATFPSWHRITP
jgi:hypothetical protein